ncbi:acyloxyacyl hydrolase [Comamonas humi]
MFPRPLLPIAAAIGAAGFLGSAQAQFLDSRQAPTLYMQAGAAKESARSLTVGSTVPMAWYSRWGSHLITAHWDMSLAVWNSHLLDDSRKNIVVLGLAPTLRLHSGSSFPWFVEAGIGGFLSNRVYHSRDKDFSTAFNFGTHLGAGFFSGPRRENEWSVRLEHFSNAGIKSPNPGENFVQLRYARHF